MKAHAAVLVQMDAPPSSIPSFRARASSQPPARGASPSRGKKSKIAIVEDEGDLLAVYSAFFRNMGFETVSGFGNGEDILLAVSGGAVAPDIVIMDYRLPGKDGLETATKIVAMRPSTKIVITTADDAIKARASGMGFKFLQKPFSLADLLAAVRDS
jgi:DNA-binding response OmpR family regulator